MFAYLTKLLGNRRLALAARSKPRGRGRLGLEVLEDRAVPSSLALVAFTGGPGWVGPAAPVTSGLNMMGPTW
jgi:hypothetical protein